MKDHIPLEMPAFNGAFARGDNRLCPPDHFIEARNKIFEKDEVVTRNGFNHDLVGKLVKRHFIYKRSSAHNRLLFLDENGKLWDQDFSVVTPILDIALMTDFSAITLFDRCYITPHDGRTGLSGEVVYVYDATAVARAIGSAPPGASGMTSANSATAGNIAAGVHAYAVVFESASGALSAPGSFTNLNSTGSKKVDLAAIPTGPAGTVARHIMATAILDNFAGDYENQEWFFVPNGELAGNVATTLTIDFYEGDLTDGADYLFDILEEVPAGVSIGVYNGRLVVTGEFDNPHYARISEEGDPEVFNEIDGFVSTNPNDGAGALANHLVSRGQLYLFKNFRTFVTTDNGGAAATWNLDKVDSFLGAYPHSIGMILDAAENTVTDMAIVGNISGLYLFDGKFSDSPLSFNVQDWWEAFDKSQLYLMWVVIDPTIKTVYAYSPQDVGANMIYVCNYENGLAPESVKWSDWLIYVGLGLDLNPRSATLEIDYVSGEVEFKIGSDKADALAHGIFVMAQGVYGDGQNSYMITARLRFPYASAGPGVNHFGGIQLEVEGATDDNMSITLYPAENELNSESSSPRFIVLKQVGDPGFRLPVQRSFNFCSHKCSVLLMTESSGTWFKLTRARLYANIVAEEYPETA